MDLGYLGYYLGYISSIQTELILGKAQMYYLIHWNSMIGTFFITIIL